MIKKTPLYDTHVKLGGRMVEYAGYSLPVLYESSGLIAEHNAVRNSAGIFDVSHMGEIVLKGESAVETVNNLITSDITDMLDGQIKYGMMLNDEGGEVDDLLVYKIDEEIYMLVVNAANHVKDVKWIEDHLLYDTIMEDISYSVAQIALQGPKSEAILRKLMDSADIPHQYYTFFDNSGLGCRMLISRTGYTGEDGFEIYTSNEDIVKVYDDIIKAGNEFGILPCGLGARDTLRFEACLPLYGHELSEEYLATEVGLNFFINIEKPNFIGKEALLINPATYKRKAAKMIDKGIAREGCLVYDMNNNQVGIVTTGTHSPTLGYPIVMLRLLKDFHDTLIQIDVRGRKLKAELVKMPFYKKVGRED